VDADLVALGVEALGLQESVSILEQEGVVDRSSQLNVTAVTRALCLLETACLTSAHVIEGRYSQGFIVKPTSGRGVHMVEG